MAARKRRVEVDRHILEQGVEGLAVRASKGPTLTGEPLLRLADRLRSFKRVLAKIDQRVDSRLVAVVVHVTGFGKTELRERKRVESAVPAIRARLEKKYPDIFPLSVDVGWETEHGAATLRINPRPGPNARPLTIDWNLVESEEYGELYSVEHDIRSIGPAPYFVWEVKRDGRETEETQIADSDALWDYIDARGHKAAGRAEDPPQVTELGPDWRDPPKETLAQKVERARGVARDLSAATDSLNAGLADAEKMLKSIGLGVYASVTVEDDGEVFSEIAFAKVDGDWKIALVEGQHDQPGDESRTPILTCSKEDRFRAAEVLPDLVDALIAAGEAQLKTAGERVREVGDLVKGMRAGASR